MTATRIPFYYMRNKLIINTLINLVHVHVCVVVQGCFLYYVQWQI